jgi:hypothetical protein
MSAKKPFTFEISLSVLDHLGRNLYRNFATVLGEAISNSWDADAKNVQIFIDKEKNSFFIKDDGVGMTAEDFQSKFLKIGYSKRKEGGKVSPGGRPYIGRKGIGKLALLSCADKITVISKVKGSEYIGGTIDNSGLDEAITSDLTPQQYPLENWKSETFDQYTKDHEQGTIIYFENVKDGIKRSLDYLKKITALYFRFSLLDDSFNIFIDGEEVTLDHLKELAESTQFLWNINGLKDSYIDTKLTNLKEAAKPVAMTEKVKGFIASVTKPSNLKVAGTEERAGVDLFVNGRLRERDILKHIPTARVAENYFYGQIHFDELDDGEDRFTTSRESIIADDPIYKEFLENLRKKILEIVTDWDNLRRKYRNDGDPENPSVSPKERKAEELYNAVTADYEIPKGETNWKMVDEWVGALGEDARFNFASYAECYVSENLIRKYIEENKIALSDEAKEEIDKYKGIETGSKGKGNISIDIRKSNIDLSYLSMDGLANLVDKGDKIKDASLSRDANEYKPIRDALAHTALLTDEAKSKLTSVYVNIKGRIKALLSAVKP